MILIQVFTKYGLQAGILISNLLNTASTWLRFAGSGGGPAGFLWVLFGQVMGGMAQTLYSAAPPFLSSLWFPVHQRATATCVILKCPLLLN